MKVGELSQLLNNFDDLDEIHVINIGDNPIEEKGGIIKRVFSVEDTEGDPTLNATGVYLVVED